MNQSFEKTLNYLNLALKNVPNKNNATHIKTGIKTLISKIEDLNSKNVKRKEFSLRIEKEWQERINSIKDNILKPQDTIKAIEKLIDLENQKIEDSNSETLID